MSEYTSLDVSKRLAEAGFIETADGYWTLDGDGGFFVSNVATVFSVAYSYRSDTLEMWLLSLNAKEVAAKMGLRTLAENGTHGALRIQKLDNGGYIVQLYRPIDAGAQAPILVDALGQLVCEVLKVMA
jgi:hypothetical protein